MPFRIIRDNIVNVKADAIVNTANPKPLIGSGTDSAVYRAAGEKQLYEKRLEIGDIAPGDAQVTPAFDLNAKYIIHTCGPAFGRPDEAWSIRILSLCYRNSLRLAEKLECESVALPLISSGNNGFPKDVALSIALSEIEGFLYHSEMDVILVVFDDSSFEISSRLYNDIEQFIDSADDDLRFEKCCSMELDASCYAMNIPHEGAPSKIKKRRIVSNAKQSMPAPAAQAEADTVDGSELDDFIKKTDMSFQEKLFELIDSKGYDDVEVYKRANIDRKLFSHIRCTPGYRPKKKTAVAFAVALRLTMPETLDLLSRAGYTLSPSDRFDLIISFFIGRGVYDIYTINSALFRYDQQILG